MKLTHVPSIFMFVIAVFLTGCGYKAAIEFPPPDELFVTTGDGDIQKPYTPIGQVIYHKISPGIGIPLFNLLVPATDPEVEMNTGFLKMAKGMGANGVINTDVQWIRPSSFWWRLIGLGHNGGVLIQGTAIRR